MRKQDWQPRSDDCNPIWIKYSFDFDLDEPDLIIWKEKISELYCCVKRNSKYGFLCGYVQIGDIKVDVGELMVHGGITYDGGPLPDIEYPDNLDFDTCDFDSTWIGFDCFHASDEAPVKIISSEDLEEDAISLFCSEVSAHPLKPQYRTVEYVINECTKLARQIRQMNMGRGPEYWDKLEQYSQSTFGISSIYPERASEREV